MQAAGMAISCFSLAPKLFPTFSSPPLGFLPVALPRKRFLRRSTRGSLEDEKEALPAPARIDFDGKLPFFAPSLFRRRFITGAFAGTVIAVGADFLGSTSAILSLNPGFFRSLRADILYPIGGYKRYFDTSKGFEFIFPKAWVGDQTLLYRAVERGERERSLDLPSLQRPSKQRPIEPVVAFGPPGTSGELNVSIVVAPVPDGFMLEKLGDPKEAGMTILQRSIAPQGSNKVAKLIDAARRDDMGVVYYTLEYTVQGPSFYRHNVAVYAVTPEKKYPYDDALKSRASL